MEFDGSTVKDYTVTEENGLKKVEMVLADDTQDAVLEWLYYFTELEWNMVSYKGTVVAVLDAEGNLVQIEVSQVATAKYSTYEVSVEIKDSLKMQ